MMFTLDINSTSSDWVCTASMWLTLDFISSMSSITRMMITISRSLSRKQDCRLEDGGILVIIDSKSFLFSPVNFLVERISSSMSYSLSIDRDLISVRILLAILKCISIFFFLSVISGSLSIVAVKLLLRSFADPP